MTTVSTLVEILKTIKPDEVTLRAEQGHLYIYAGTSFGAKIESAFSLHVDFICDVQADIFLPILRLLENQTSDTPPLVTLEETLLRISIGDTKFYYLPCQRRYSFPSFPFDGNGTLYTLSASLPKTLSTAIKATKKADPKYHFIVLQVGETLTTAVGTDGYRLLAASTPHKQPPEHSFLVSLPLDLAVTLSKLPDNEESIKMYFNDTHLSFHYGGFVFVSSQSDKAAPYIPEVKQMLNAFKEFPITASISLNELQPLSSLTGTPTNVTVTREHIEVHEAQGEIIIPLTTQKWECDTTHIEILLNGAYLGSVPSLFPKRGKVNLYLKEALSPVFFVGKKNSIELVYCFMPMKRM